MTCTPACSYRCTPAALSPRSPDPPSVVHQYTNTPSTNRTNTPCPPFRSFSAVYTPRQPNACPLLTGTISPASTCARRRGGARGVTNARTSGIRATSTERARTLTCSAATAASLCRLLAGELPSRASFASKTAGEPTYAAHRRNTDDGRATHQSPHPASSSLVAGVMSHVC